MKALMLYIHIPFCVKKCAYCDFLSGPAGAKEINRYVAALCQEINAYRDQAEAYEVESIFFGGGTPSMINEEQITKIVTQIQSVFKIKEDAEITIECNPGTVTREKLIRYKELGINRLSFGLQSADNQELKHLGRIHSYETFLENYGLARELGFNNINVDLMSALPGQTKESYCETLTKIIGLQPEHISAYSLILEEGTPFYEMYGEEGLYKDAIPSEEVDREMYHETKRMLQEAGYERYEISNYAKKGYACRHNVGYWRRREYLGLGLGASSLINKERFHNTEDMEKYQEACSKFGEESSILYNSSKFGEVSRNLYNIREENQKLSTDEEMEEFMFLGLRLSNGIGLQEFEDTFAQSMDEVYGEVIQKLKKEQLIAISEGRMYLTEVGMDVSNYVFSEFLLNNDE